MGIHARRADILPALAEESIHCVRSRSTVLLAKLAMTASGFVR